MNGVKGKHIFQITCITAFSFFLILHSYVAFGIGITVSTETIKDLRVPNISEFIIGVSDLRDSIKQRSPIILIDTRSKEKFEKARIPGSLHMELYSIKTKGFLKEKDVVIVDDGFRLFAPLNECIRLKKEAGFKSVRVLYGGIQTWIDCGGKIEGINARFPAKHTFKEPLLLFEERDMADWVVLDLFGEKERIKRLFPKWTVVSIHSLKDTNRIKKSLEKAINSTRKKKGNLIRYLVFLNGRGSKDILSKADGDHLVFAYEGTLSSYESFLKKQARILKAKDEIERKREKEGLRKPCGCGL